MKDISFIKDLKNNPVILSDDRYVKSIVYIMFNSKPGVNEYQPKRGLDILAKVNVAETSNFRDVEYENEIISQFSTYTDLQVSNVVAIYKDKKIIISMDVFFNNVMYKLVTGHDSNSLTVLLKD